MFCYEWWWWWWWLFIFDPTKKIKIFFVACKWYTYVYAVCSFEFIRQMMIECEILNWTECNQREYIYFRYICMCNGYSGIYVSPLHEMIIVVVVVVTVVYMYLEKKNAGHLHTRFYYIFKRIIIDSSGFFLLE